MDMTVPLAPEHVRFCSRCGAHADAAAHERPSTRVCASCGMGVYLGCARDALGTLGTFFLVVGDDLRVTAVSEAAETIFGPERVLVGTDVTSLVRTPLGQEPLRFALNRALRGVREPAPLRIQPATAGARGLGPLEARVSPCGPPRGALVAVEPAIA